MPDLAAKYGIPAELMTFVDDGFLEVLRENEAEKTIVFHIPSKRHSDAAGRITTYSLTWIHPDFNDRFCHYYIERPGDSPNFYVSEEITDVGDEQPDLQAVDDLVAWLESLRLADVP